MTTSATRRVPTQPAPDSMDPFEDLARLATVVAEVPLAFVTVVDDTRSYWNSAIDAERSGAYAPEANRYNSYLIAAGGSVVVNDTGTESGGERLDGESGIRAWAGHPVYGPSGEIVGGFFMVSHEPRRWSEWEVQTLATLARAASQEIALREALRLSDERLVAMTRAHQIAIDLARTLQDSLLPPALPGVPGVQIAARYQATGTTDVVGDFYDLFHVVGGWWCAVIGDVCGHGIEAAKVTALARYTLRAEANLHERPSTVLADLHHALVAQHGVDGRYLTAAYVTFRVTDSGIDGRICLAGHPHPAIRRADGTVTRLGTAGSLLGAFPHVRLTDVGFRLGAGDLLLLYTDGLTERRRADDGQFGDVEFHRNLAATSGFTADETIAYVIDVADAYSEGRIDDDTALLAIQVNPARPAG